MIKNYTSKKATSQYFTKENVLSTDIGSISLFTSEKDKNNPFSWMLSCLFLLTLFIVGSTKGYSQVAQRGVATTSTSATTSITINKPAGVVAGDFMIANISQVGAGATADPTLAGWTLIQSADPGGGTNRWVAILYKRAIAGEPANYTFTFAAGANASVGAIVAFSGVDGATPFDVASAGINTANAVAVTAATRTTTTANAAVIMFGMDASAGGTWSGWTTTSPGALAELYDTQNAGNSSVGAAWAIKAAAGATGVGTATLSLSARNGGVLVILRKALPPTITSLSVANGCVGSSLTINGTNLGGATSVTIGGQPATITANTAGSVTATVGVGASGTATVNVVTPGGTVNSVATYTVNPSPTIVLSSGAGTNSQTVCISTPITSFTHTIGGSATGASTAGLPAGVTGSLAGSIYTISGTPTASGTFNYTITTSGGLCAGATAIGTITVNAPPAAIGGGALTVCTGLTTPAFTDATGGGTWSITNVTGTASITVGGVVTGLTAGNVTVVYTLGACSVTKTLTVNTTPVAIGGGAATVCTGANTPAFTDATGGGTWSITAGSGTASITAGGVVTGTTAGTVTVVYTLGTCSVSTPLTVMATPAITTNPSNSVIVAGANTSFTTVASNTPTSYTWQVSTDGGGTWTTVVNGGVYSTAATATLNITAAPIGMNGYQYHVSATNTCGTSAYSTAATLTVTLNYCVPTYATGDASNDHISNVTLGTLNNSSGASLTPFYTFYNAVTIPNLLQSSTASVSVTLGSDANQYVGVWIDYNQDGTFQASEGAVSANAGSNGTVVLNIPIPAGAVLGNTRMRVRGGNDTVLTTAQACGASSSVYGETEDYIVNIITNPPCSTPTAQPTVLILTPPAGGTTINGSFTAAAPVPDNYLVVISTSATPPTPVNGNTYTIGGTVETGGYLVVDTDNNTTFSATGLSPGTLYYVYVFSYNAACTGGPNYNTTGPLNGSATTTTVVVGAYCTAATTLANNTLYINDVDFIGTLQDTNNDGTGFTTAPTAGYHDYTGLPTKSIQAQGEGVNVYVGAKTYRGHWKVWVDWNKDGDFLDANELVYNSGGIGTSTTTFGFIIPPTTAPGDYRIRIRVYNSFRNSNGAENYSLDYTPCETFDTYAAPASTEYGEAEDYLFTVVASCSAIIKTVTSGQTCGTGTVTLSATGSVGTTSYHWYTTATGGAPIAGATTSSYTTPVLASTTTYYVTADNGSCESKVRTAVVATINPIPTLNFTPAAPEVCGENTIINLTASGDIEKVDLINETFEGGTLGVFTNNNIVVNGAALDSKSMWKNRTSTFVPAEQVWFPAISSGFGANKFVMATSDIGTLAENALESAVLNSTGFLDLNLTFRIYYSSYLDGTDPLNDFVKIEVSTNGGGAWTTIDTYTTDQGFGTKFLSKSYNLNAYINQPNLKIRIHYYGNWTDGLAVDDIELYGNKPLNTAFNWTGASLPDVYSNAACTIPYVTGTPAVTVWIKPTLTQLEQGTYTFTASATLSNGCSASTPITVTNKSRVWKGTTDNDWNKPSNWLPATVPAATDCVIIPTGTNSKIMNAPDALAKNVTVKAPSGNLELQSGKNLTVTDWINVEAGATFNVRNSANLVQVNPVANTGNINMERIANIFLQDYVYWASPVGNAAAGTFPVTSVSPATPSGYIYKWGTTTANANGGQGTWVGTAENMIPGIGYIVRGPNGFNNATKTNLTANFIGVPNNGTFTTTINRGTDFTTVGTQGIPRTATDDNWNLLGNPYPSSIGINEFLTANSANLSGGVRLWTHGNLPTNATDPFYQNFATNYYATDYIAVNLTGATSGPGDVKIASGQGFMVLMNAGAAGSASVTFNNTMRSAAFANNVFYKNETSTNQNLAAEKHRIWLDLVSPFGTTTRTLVGYITGATQATDDLYDSFTDYKNPQNFYSLINNEIMQIQGRALPFDNADFVPMGFKTSQSGSHSIGIAAVEGIFSDASQDILIEDKLLNITHNLKESPYTFTSAVGTFNDRFVLRYATNALSTPDFDYANSVKIYANSHINITSANQSIKEVIVYDILGKTLYNKKKVNANELSINELTPTSSVLIVKVILENNAEVIKKVVF